MATTRRAAGSGLAPLPAGGTRPFFVSGGTLRLDVPSYVERAADAELLLALRKGDLCYLLTPRQMGKSSLMVRTATRLMADGVTPAMLDLTALGHGLTPEQFYRGILTLAAERFGPVLERAWAETAYLGPVQRLMAALRELVHASPGRRFVLFIDEIDSVRNQPFGTDDFFAALREFHNRRAADGELERLTFCLLGVASPTDLIRDAASTPFNIGHRIELTDFTAAEAEGLLPGLQAAATSGDARATLRRIMYWTGGHPYLTQRLAAATAEGGALTPDATDRRCAALFFGQAAWERDSNLGFVRERLLRAHRPDAAPEEVRVSLLERYDRALVGKPVADDPGDAYCGLLRLSGIVRSERAVLTPRNRIYQRVFDRKWVADHLPGAEIRRQTAAFKRGVLRTALVAGAAVLAMAGITGWALVKATEARHAVAAYERLRADERALRQELDRVRSRAVGAEGDLRRVRESHRGNLARLAQAEAKNKRLADETAGLRADLDRREADLARATAQRERLFWSKGDGNKANGIASYWNEAFNRGNYVRVTRVVLSEATSFEWTLPNGEKRGTNIPAGDHKVDFLLNGDTLHYTTKWGTRPLDLYGVEVDGSTWRPGFPAPRPRAAKPR